MNLSDLIGLSSSQLGLPQLLGRFGVAIAVGLFIMLIYKMTYSGVAFSKSFSVTLIMTTIVTAAILMVINSNIALSLGMVGALSIIRFRSAIKDPRDVGFLFWAVGAGLASGTGLFPIAILLSVIMAVLLLVMRFFPGDSGSYMLVVKGNPQVMQPLKQVLSSRMVKKSKAKVKNLTPSGAELIYEVTVAHGAEDKLLATIHNAAPDCVVNLIAKSGDTTI